MVAVGCGGLVSFIFYNMWVVVPVVTRECLFNRIHLPSSLCSSHLDRVPAVSLSLLSIPPHQSITISFSSSSGRRGCRRCMLSSSSSSLAPSCTFHHHRRRLPSQPKREVGRLLICRGEEGQWEARVRVGSLGCCWGVGELCRRVSIHHLMVFGKSDDGGDYGR